MHKVRNHLENRILAYILISLSFFYLLIGFNRGLNIYDEGLSVYGATRVLHEDVPYRDFWTLYAPAQFCVLACLFKLFGASIIVERIWSTIVMFDLLIVVFLNIRKLVSKKFALISWLIILIWASTYRFYAGPMPSAPLFSLLSTLCLLNFLYSKRHRLWLTLSG
ncbi:MAG: hypothetical protein ACPLPX_09820 [Candidatus Kapaibacteriota bacterium]